MTIKGFKLLKGDILIISFVLVFALIVLFFTLPKSYSENTVEIYLDSELIYSAQLVEGVSDTIEVDEVAHNTIEIDGVSVRVTDSTCYDHVCENTGYIEKSGEIIVCMPNKLLIKIVGNDGNNEYDAVVG